MRVPLYGLTVPLLLLTAAFAAMSPPALAQEDSYTIAGKVLSDEGKPLEGVRVNAYTYHEDRTRSSVGSNDEDITDADGSYELTLAAGKGWINIYYEKWRQGDGREFVLDSDETIDFTLRTPPPRDATISGIVRGPNGEPIPGAEVSLQYGCCYAYPTDPVIYETTPVAVDSPPPPTAEPAADNTSDASSADTGNGTSGSAGSSAPSRMVMPPPYYDDYQNTVTDSEGRYTFEAYAGPRSIVAWAKGYAQTTVNVEAKSGETVTADVTLEKVPGKTAILEGTIVDATTGLPLQYAQINIRNLEWGRYHWAETDAKGDFRFEALPGWTEITVNHYPRYEENVDHSGDLKIAMPRPVGTQYYPYSTLVKLVDGENELDVELESKPKPTIALLGYVLDPDTEQGIEGAHVSVWSQDTGDWGEATTDKTGSYRIMVRPGHFTANAWKDGHLSGQQSFTVEADDATKRMNILLPKGVQKWAPCYDESDCGGGPMYYKEGDVAMRSYATPMPAAAPTPAASASGGTVNADEGADASGAPAPALAMSESLEAQTFGAAGPDRSNAATFEGSGGGLPPYDPATDTAEPANGINSADNVGPGETAPVPGLGLAALLAVLAIGAFAMSRRGRT